MTTHLYPEFILAVTALMLLPGPNVALITANSVSHGVRAGLLTVAGTASAMVIQLAITAMGLDAILRPTPWFTALRWAGILYLIYLGLRAWRAKPTDATPAPHIFRRGLVVSLTNPKTLFFYAAFFP
jgi:threonine/homoserine/homoserine lactone efflux protein